MVFLLEEETGLQVFLEKQFTSIKESKSIIPLFTVLQGIPDPSSGPLSFMILICLQLLSMVSLQESIREEELLHPQTWIL